jgi:hypothetical protein
MTATMRDLQQTFCLFVYITMFMFFLQDIFGGNGKAMRIAEVENFMK